MGETPQKKCSPENTGEESDEPVFRWKSQEIPVELGRVGGIDVLFPRQMGTRVKVTMVTKPQHLHGL